jgi:hypothetical protein
MVAQPVQTPDADEAAPPVREASPEEGMAMLERQAQRNLGISAEEFLRRWYGGFYAGHADQPGVANVAMLLSFVQDSPLVRAYRR